MVFTESSNLLFLSNEYLRKFHIICFSEKKKCTILNTSRDCFFISFGANTLKPRDTKVLIHKVQTLWNYR